MLAGFCVHPLSAQDGVTRHVTGGTSEGRGCVFQLPCAPQRVTLDSAPCLPAVLPPCHCRVRLHTQGKHHRGAAGSRQRGPGDQGLLGHRQREAQHAGYPRWPVSLIWASLSLEN